MAKYIKYNPNVPGITNVLVGKNESQQTGNISKISICNERPITSAGVTIVDIYLYDGDSSNDIYIIKQVEIPEGTALVLEDNLSFNISKYSLKINATDSSSSGVELSIIIK